MSRGRTTSVELITAFDKISRNMRKNSNISWEDFIVKYCPSIEKFQTSSDDETDLKNAEARITQMRNYYKNTFNTMAKKHGKKWRLYNSKSGETIYKADETQMVLMETLRRLFRIADSVKLVKSALEPMLQYAITKNDKDTINSMISISNGSKMGYIGGINSLKCLPNDFKETTIARFE